MAGKDAMAIIFPNMHDKALGQLTAERTSASLPFAGRYRLIDFGLSAMVAAGVYNVGIVVKQNYQSLFRHLGNGRDWDLSRKRGGLTTFSPYGDAGATVYRGRVGAIAQIREFIENSTEEYVILMDGDVVCLPDFKKIIDAHAETGADITVVYQKMQAQAGTGAMVLELESDGAIKDMRDCDATEELQDISMNIIIVGRKLLLDLVHEATRTGKDRFERDIIAANVGKLRMRGYQCTGYRSHIYSLESYFDANLALLDPANRNALFKKDFPVLTKVYDEAPARYKMGSVTHSSILADGCMIEGTVKNSVLFRGVTVGKGAVVENCVLMSGTVVAPGAHLNYCLSDKNVQISTGKTLAGTKESPLYIPKGTAL